MALILLVYPGNRSANSMVLRSRFTLIPCFLVCVLLLVGPVAGHPLLSESTLLHHDKTGEAISEKARPPSVNDPDQRVLPISGDFSRNGLLPRAETEVAASGNGPERSAVLTTSAPPDSDDSREFFALDAADFAAGLRQPLVGNWGRAAPAPRGSASRGAIGDEDVLPADLAAVLTDLQISAKQAIADALDARVDKNGRISFSLAGFEGFHFSAATGGVTVGYADAALSMVKYGDDRDDGPWMSTSASAVDRSEHQAAPVFNPAKELVGLVRETVTYPLFWVVIIFLVIGKVAFLIATRWQRRKRRGISAAHSRSSRKRVRVKVRRSRSRLRHHEASGTESMGADSSAPQVT